MMLRFVRAKTNNLAKIASRSFCQAQPIHTDHKASTESPTTLRGQKFFEVVDKTGIVVTLADQKGILNKALSVFDKNGIDLTHIHSKPSNYVRKERAFDMFISFKGSLEDDNVRDAISELSKMSCHLTVSGTPQVPWFPTHIQELNKIGKETLAEGEGIEMTDHPGFNDKEYKERRNFITNVALEYNMEDPEIPRIKYNEDELSVWKYCYPKLKKLYVDGACKEHNEAIEQFEKY